MVQGYPEIYISEVAGYNQSNPENEQIWGICLECTKGEPFVPTLILTPSQLAAEFGVRLDGFFGVGGQGLYVVRVTAGTPLAAVQGFYDNATTAVKVLTLTAKTKGSKPIVANAGPNASGGSNLTINQDGLPPEYYFGVLTIDDLVARINANSNIVTAAKNASGTNVLGLVNNLTLGTGLVSGDVEGTDGTTKTGANEPDDMGELDADDAPTAHRTGLTLLENYDINGVFTISPYETVQDEYVIHAETMSQSMSHKWRAAVVGAASTDNSKAKILERTAVATGYNSQAVRFVGQGLVDRVGEEYPPYMATQAVAGKRSALFYGESIWGGESKKKLGTGGENFFVEVMPMVSAGTTTTLNDFREYNEKGVITFYRDIDGVRIREGVTTVQPGEEGEDEEAVVSVITEAKRKIYDAAKSMLGKNITPSYKTDLEQKIISALEEMKNQDQTLIDLPDEDIKAYTVQVTVVPRSTQIEGKVQVSATITPVHCAREVRADVVIL